MTGYSTSSLILIDAHVHLHACFAVDRVLTSALRNFSQAASRLGASDAFSAGLLLTEMQGESWFQTQTHHIQQAPSQAVTYGDWTLTTTAEPCSLKATHTSGKSLWLMAGRQVVTQERLEVLALITSENFADGDPLPKTLQAITKADGIPVLPWGVGKWIGRRGGLVDTLLQQENSPAFYLGDNSGRPLGWQRPQRFRIAEKRGLYVLPGTDPLPLASETSRPGSFGFALRGEWDAQQPGMFLKAALRSPDLVMQPYGALETPWRFVANQVALRLQKTA